MQTLSSENLIPTNLHIKLIIRFSSATDTENLHNFPTFEKSTVCQMDFFPAFCVRLKLSFHHSTRFSSFSRFCLLLLLIIFVRKDICSTEDHNLNNSRNHLKEINRKFFLYTIFSLLTISNLNLLSNSLKSFLI